MRLIDYECLKCGAEWTRLEEQEPLGTCPGCGTYDYDKPKRGGTLKVCSVCHREYLGYTSAHGLPGPCSEKCTNKQRHSPRVGEFI